MTNNSLDATQRAVVEMADVERQAATVSPHRPWETAADDVLNAVRASEPQNYHYLATVLKRHTEQVLADGHLSATVFSRLVLFDLARRLIDGRVDLPYRIPESIQRLRFEKASRIIRDVADAAWDEHWLSSDLFKKDMAVAAGRLLPVGAQLIQPDSGIPRSVLFRDGLRQIVRGAWYFVLRRRGFHGYCAFHMDGRDIDEFNPEGWLKTYLRIADFLELNPSVQGVFGTAWFYDPAVTEITPHLAYLREVREAAGARNFRYGSTQTAIDTALAKSRRRVALYEQGRYRPQSYYLVWHRRELLPWAAQQETDSDG